MVLAVASSIGCLCRRPSHPRGLDGRGRRNGPRIEPHPACCQGLEGFSGRVHRERRDRARESAEIETPRCTEIPAGSRKSTPHESPFGVESCRPGVKSSLRRHPLPSASSRLLDGTSSARLAAPKWSYGPSTPVTGSTPPTERHSMRRALSRRRMSQAVGSSTRGMSSDACARVERTADPFHGHPRLSMWTGNEPGG